MLGQKYYKMLPDTMRFCSDDSSAYIELKHELEKSATIQWNTPGAVISSIKKLKVSKESGRYKLKVVSPQGVFRDSTYVKLYTKPKLYLRDTLVCKGQALVLDARNAGMKYSWNTRETTQKIKVESSGRYWVKISNSGCSVVDTVRVKFLQNALNTSSSEVTFCLNEENKTLSVKGNAGGRILWSTGATSPSITAAREGVYWVRTDNRECGIQTDSVRVKLKACECEMLIPNSFTPNEDNRNDYFFPVVQCEYVNYSLTISDRWGNTVFTTNNVNAKWDGRFKGNLCPEDIYVYHIETTEKITDKKLIRNGHISLFR